jgi:hypothetical protein
MPNNNNDRIKVVGYAQRVFYDNGIEYRNFSDDLVGNQLTSDADGTDSTFTFGNFVTTVNNEGRVSRLFSTKKFTKFYTLQNLDLTTNSSNTLLNNNIKTTLNLDGSELCSFAYFGSATEYIRVSLENIISNWPASLFLNPLRDVGIQTVVGNTFDNYSYDVITDTSTFRVDVNFIVNNFNINYKQNGTTLNTFNQDNVLRNLSVSYDSYSVLTNDKEYNVVAFTGSTSNTDDFINFRVIGDPFSGATNGNLEYHIKPNELTEEKYFNSLSEFENNLLNRFTLPKYSSTYNYKLETDGGDIISTTKKLTWPVTDGYNIDFNTTEYINYVSDLLEVTNAKDSTYSDLIIRFLTSDSITDFDTIPTCDGSTIDSEGEKINKTLRIYGREFDEIKKYIDGIKFANIVTYDKKNNIPDQLVKYLARTLGWELTSSLIGNDLITNYLKVGTATYPGYSRGYTPQEAEVELWRRLVLNSSHIWKTKGTRNPIEFFFKLIGTPDGLINFNEYVYRVKEPIDMDLFYKVLEYNDLDSDLEKYNVDSEGYPKFFRDTPDMYFQKGGGWYRETAGSAATQYTLVGNNPHVGPYDSGKEYIAQLDNIIPDFSAFTLTSTTVTTGTTNLFTNYNSGLMNQYNGNTYVDAQTLDGADLSDVVLLETTIDEDLCPEPELTDCGCDVPEDDESLFIDVTLLKKETTEVVDCENVNLNPKNNYINTRGENYYYWQQTFYNLSTPFYINTEFVNPVCCETKAQGYSYLHTSYAPEYYIPNSNTEITTGRISLTEVNTGYICCQSPGIIKDAGKGGCGCTLSCKWELVGPTIQDQYELNGFYYLKFIDPEGNNRVVNEADSCFCPRYTSPEVILDPYTNKNGYACKINEKGLFEFGERNTKETNYYYGLFRYRKAGKIDCNSETIPSFVKSLYE